MYVSFIEYNLKISHCPAVYNLHTHVHIYIYIYIYIISIHSNYRIISVSGSVIIPMKLKAENILIQHSFYCFIFDTKSILTDVHTSRSRLAPKFHFLQRHRQLEISSICLFADCRKWECMSVGGLQEHKVHIKLLERNYVTQILRRKLTTHTPTHTYIHWGSVIFSSLRWETGEPCQHDIFCIEGI